MQRSICWTKTAATTIVSLAALNEIYHRFVNDDNERDITSCESPPQSPPSNKPKNGAKLLFLGSGSSTGCPKPLCAIIFGEGSNFSHKSEETTDTYLQLERLYEHCKISRLATFGDPKDNKNYRNNPSLLISHCNNDDGKCDRSTGNRNVVIDTGKTFRESAIRFMPMNGITSLDAVVLTHEHMDAVGGLDDLRGFQVSKYRAGDGPMTQLALPIYLSDQCYRSIAKMYPYLLPREFSDTEIIRHVAKLDFQRIYHYEPFIAAGLKMIPLPVIHGEDFISNGYAFSLDSEQGKMNVIYLSDISRMPEKTLEYVREYTPQPVHVLIVDALLVGDKQNPVHYNLNEAISLARCLKAHKTYVVGMNCDDFLPHDEMNEELRRDYGGDVDIQLAHDGLVVGF